MSIFRKILYKYRRSRMNPHQLAESYRPLLHHLGTEPYLISIGNDVTVAADVKFVTHDVSVVTKHIPDNEVWGGSPAKFIMTTEEYARSIVARSDEYPWMDPANMTRKSISSEDMAQQRQKYFFK